MVIGTLTHPCDTKPLATRYRTTSCGQVARIDHEPTTSGISDREVAPDLSTGLGPVHRIFKVYGNGDGTSGC